MNPLHMDKEVLFCNKCNKDIDRIAGTLVCHNEVYCRYCNNWICGERDAFGKQGRFNYLNNSSILVAKLKNIKIAIDDIIKFVEESDS